MSKLTKAAAAPVIVTDENGIEWKATPPTFGMIAEFEEWSEVQMLRVTEAALGAEKACRHAPRGGAATQAMLNTARGTARFALMVLKPEHPEVTAETVEEMTSDTRVEIVDRAIEASMPDGKPKSGGGDDAPFRPSVAGLDSDAGADLQLHAGGGN